MRNIVTLAAAVALLALVLANSASADLVAYWKFDDSIDSETANGDGGTLNGGSSYVAGKFGQAIQFTGSGSSNLTITTGASSPFDTGNALTVSMWADTSSIFNSGLLTRLNGSTYYYIAGYTNGLGWYSGYARNTTANNSATESTLSGWYNGTNLKLITLVYDRYGGTQNLRIYINGGLVGATDTADSPLGAAGAGWVQIGTWSGGGSATRVIDDTAIFNNAFSNAEVLATYNLANSSLTYAMGDAWTLFKEHNAATHNPAGVPTSDGKKWTYRNDLTDLAGTQAGTVSSSGSTYTLYLTETTGMVGVPSPSMSLTAAPATYMFSGGSTTLTAVAGNNGEVDGLTYTVTPGGANVTVINPNPAQFISLGLDHGQTANLDTTVQIDPVGEQTVTWTVSATNAGITPSPVSTTVTVLAHSAAAFGDGDADLDGDDRLVLDFGTVNQGATPADLSYTLANLLADWRDNLEFDSQVSTTDATGRFNVTLPTGLVLATGDTSSSAYSVSFVGTDTPGTFEVTYVLGFSDEEDGIGGAQASNAQPLTLVLRGTVVPEPATMGFLALGGLSMLGAAIRRRRRAD